MAIRRVKTPNILITTSYLLLGLFILTILLLLLLPWQQTIIGTGKVTVFSPMQRPQHLEAEIPAKLKKWHVLEGQSIKEGQLIAELTELDPKFLDNNQIERLEEQKRALNKEKEAAKTRTSALELKIQAVENSKQAAVPEAEQKVVESKQKVIASEKNLATATINLQRLQELFKQGLRSQRDLELAELAHVNAQTNLQQAQATLNASIFNLAKTREDASAKVADSAASIASAQEKIAAIQAKIAKLSIEIENLHKRKEQRFIKSPIDGKIVRLLQVGSGETVKTGDILAKIVPDTQDQAVELYVSAWDVPLIREGKPVRLQFAGWPALQFSGWPMIATGTFGGKVSVIDAVDDGTGMYRILVKPDIEAINNNEDDPWPSANYLRPGAEAHGWILLDKVSLGYELWRQFNAFPPSLKTEPEEESSKQKLPETSKVKIKV